VVTIEELTMRQRIGVAVFAVALLGAAAAARADYRQDKSYSLPPGGDFFLSTEAGGASIRGGEGDQARVVISSRRGDFDEKYEVIVEETPGRLEITIEHRGRKPWSWSFGDQGAHVEVTLPRRTDVVVKSSGGGIDVESIEGSVEAKSSGGGVTVLEVSGDVVASSSGGGVEVERIGGGAKLDSSGGSVSARRVAGDIDAGSSGGGVRIDEAGGAVVASSSGGGVRVGFAAGNAKGGDLHSSGGGVTARVDPSVGLEIDAYASGGDADCELPVTVRGKMKDNTVRGTLNGGGAVLKLRSSGGGVTIEGR
jgi:hypothetical protein